MKNNKWKIITSTLLILFPVIAGIIVDFAPIIILPVILALFNLLCWAVSSKDLKGREQNEKALRVVYWILPLISFWVSGMMYCIHKNISFNPVAYTILFLSAMFIFIGNYMPKITINRTLGIKIKTTLSSEYNWQKTHRFAGRVWFACGVIGVFCVFIPAKVLVFIYAPLLVAAIFAPVIYSLVIYNKQKKEGTLETTEITGIEYPKWAKPISIIAVTVILIGVAVLMFTGNVTVDYSQEESFTIETTYNGDITIKYEDIKTIEYRETFKRGMRVMGFDSAKLALGTYQNSEYDRYTSCIYKQCDAAVIIATENEIIVVNGVDTKATQEIYNKISQRCQITVE